MIHSKLLDNNKNLNFNLNFSESLYKGAFVKIKNSKKSFQVIGINLDKKICWLREWPVSYAEKKTFALHISQITIQDLSVNDFTKELNS